MATRSEIASDTFDSAISGSWENGGGDWDTCSWASGGFVQPTNVSADAALRRSTGTYANNQYSRVVIGGYDATLSANSVGACCRMQAGTDESAYIGYVSSGTDAYEIYETNSSFGFSLLASAAFSGNPAANDEVILEVEGTALRLYTKQGAGAETLRVSTTDNTLTSGTPGIALYGETSAANARVTTWSGGDLTAGGAALGASAAGTASATGALTTQIKPAAAATDVATVAAALTTQIKVAASAADVASATAGLNTGSQMAASAASITAAAAGLTTQINAAAAATVSAAVAAALSTGIPLAGSATDVATATGALGTGNATPPSVRSVGTVATATGGGTLQPALPAGLAQNDIMVIEVVAGGNVTTLAATGWTEHATILTTVAYRHSLLWKRAGASESAPSITGHINDAIAQITAIQGCPTSGDPFDTDVGFQENADSVTIGALGITPAGNGRLILFLGTRVDQGATAVNFASYSGTNPDFIEALDSAFEGGIYNFGMFLAAGSQATAAATGNRTATASDSGVNSAGLFALKPANEGGAPGAALAADAAAVAAATAALTTQIRAAAAAADVASAAGALNTSISLVAAAVSNAIAAGSLTTQIKLAAAASGQATASGGLQGAPAALQAAAADVVSATGALTTLIQLGAAAIDVASVISASLTNWATVTLTTPLYTGQGGALDPTFWLDAVPVAGTTLYYDGTHITIQSNGEIYSDTNNTSAVVQFFDGTNWALGLIVITPDMAATSAGSATATGALTTAINLAAVANAAVIATGALTTSIPLTATAQDLVSASVGSLLTQIRLAAAATGVTTATASFNAIALLDAAAQVSAAATAALTTGKPLAADSAASATATAALSTGVALGGAANDVATMAAALSTAIRLAAQPQAIAAATATLDVPLALLGAAMDVATLTAVLSTGINLQANASGAVAASADFSTGARLSAAAQSVTSVVADLIGTIRLAADVTNVAAATGVMISSRIRRTGPLKMLVLSNTPITVANGRSNKIDIVLMQNGVPIDSGFITGVVLKIYSRKYGTLIRTIEGRASVVPNEAALFDNTSMAVVPGGGSNPIAIFSMQLGLAVPEIPVGRGYWCNLIAFSASDTVGTSWGEFYFNVVE